MFKEVVANGVEFIKASQDGTLDEKPLKDSEGSNLRFLGTHQDMPFFMVRAGEFYFDINTDNRRNRRAIRLPVLETNQAYVTSPTSVPHIIVSQNGANDAIENHPETQGQQIIPKIPFHLSKADRNYYSLERPLYQLVIDEHRRRPDPPALEPHALCLTVFLSKASFIRADGDRRWNFNDVKIDVFYNGQLCASTYVPERCRSDAHTFTDHIVRFTGCRAGRVLEKPWVMVPPGQKPSGYFKQGCRVRGKYRDAEQRWTSISQALEKEAAKTERNEGMELSILGEYLTSLAKLDMPCEVGQMERISSSKFGVVDVVVTTGKGHKDEAGHPFLLEPKFMRPSRPIEVGEGTVISPQDVNPSKPQALTPQQTTSKDANIIIQRSSRTRKRQKMPLAGMVPKSRPIESAQGAIEYNMLQYSGLVTNLSSSMNNLRSMSQGTTIAIPKVPSSMNARRKGPSIKSNNNAGFENKPISRQKGRSLGILPLSVDAIGNNDKRRSVTTASHPPEMKPKRPLTILSKPDRGKTGKKQEKPDVRSYNYPEGSQKSYSSVSREEDEHRPKRARSHHEPVANNKMTMTEDLALNMTEAGKPEAATGSYLTPRVTRSSLASVETNSYTGSTGNTPTDKNGNSQAKRPTKTTTPKISPQKQSHSLNPFSSSPYSNSTNPTSPTTQPPFPPPSTLIPPTPRRSPRSNPPMPCPTRAPTPHSSASGSAGPSNPHSLHEDSVLTFAPEGIMRQVRGERGGWFEEEGVVLGVRFVVG